jgi:hypothetical protein
MVLGVTSLPDWGKTTPRRHTVLACEYQKVLLIFFRSARPSSSCGETYILSHTHSFKGRRETFLSADISPPSSCSQISLSFSPPLIRRITFLYYLRPFPQKQAKMLAGKICVNFYEAINRFHWQNWEFARLTEMDLAFSFLPQYSSPYNIQYLVVKLSDVSWFVERCWIVASPPWEEC